MTKHIPVDKALREVKHLSSLVQQLMENVNTALCTASETLPSLKGFITAEDHERDIENISQIVPDEKGVASYYDKTIARFCVPLASTLTLHPQASSSQWHSLVIWTTSVPCSCYGIMNGLLHFMPMPENGNKKSKGATIMERMESEKCHTFMEMSRATMSLGSWEMKSTSTGPQEVMRVVPTLGKFSWTFCNSEAWFVTQKHAKQLEKGKNTPVGPDAQNPPWNLGFIVSSAPRNEASLQTLVSQCVTRSATLSGLMPPLPRAPTQKDKGKQKAKEQGMAAAPAPGSYILPSPRALTWKDKGKETAKDQVKEAGGVGDRKRKRNADDEAYQDHHDLTAEKLVQQVMCPPLKLC